jgi:hypothetical protein
MSLEAQVQALTAAVTTLSGLVNTLNTSTQNSYNTAVSTSGSNATTATTKAAEAVTSANTATTKAAEAVASAASIAGGPVSSVNSRTGVVTLTATDVGLGNVNNTSNATERAAAATLTNKTLTDPTLADSQLIRAMLIDCGMTSVSKGNSGTSTQTYDYSAGSVQLSTATGNHTIATSNWPPTGNHGMMLIELTNGGAFTLTWPSINWVQPSGVTTTSISTYLSTLTGRASLQTSGVDQVLLWTRDAGATIYGKLI